MQLNPMKRPVIVSYEKGPNVIEEGYILLSIMSNQKKKHRNKIR